MKKQDIIKKLSEKNFIELTESSQVVNSVVDILIEALKNGEQVTIRGLGTFNVVKGSVTKARDISRNKIIDVAPYKTVKFKVSGNLKKSL